jgi:predicted ester cyclase
MTEQEKKNLEIVREFMDIAYDPERASFDAVAHLCAPENRFIAPSTFPEVHTLQQYAAEHAELMKSLNDLRFISFDVFFAQGDRVCLRYTAEGTHQGAPHGELAPTGRRARWSATAVFRLENGRLVELVIDWNKLQMWEQLGWPLEECLTGETADDIEPLVPALH